MLAALIGVLAPAPIIHVSFCIRRWAGRGEGKKVSGFESGPDSFRPVPTCAKLKSLKSDFY